MSTFSKLYESLKSKIENAYEQGATLEEAEKLSGEFLYAQMQVSEELKKLDLDSRMRKSGVKAVRAAIYLDIVQKADKKPTESQLSAMVDSDKIVMDEQERFDIAEVERDELARCYKIFQDAHIYYRQLCKGQFGG